MVCVFCVAHLSSFRRRPESRQVDFSQLIICWTVVFRFFSELLRFPNVTVFFECLFRPHGELLVLCLHKEQVTKRNAPQLPLDSCATRFAGRPSKLNLAAHTKRELLRDSDSRWPKAPANPALHSFNQSVRQMGAPNTMRLQLLANLKKEFGF